MENVNDALLNRPKLDGTQENEDAAARGLRAETAQARNGSQEEAQGGIKGTIRQMINQARQVKENELSEKSGSAEKNASNQSKSPISRLLRYDWWPGLIATWGGTLILIHAHVLGNKAFGKKVFCDLGDEWPVNFPGKKLLEVGVLVLIDLVVLMAIIIVLVLITTIVSFISGNIFDKVASAFKVITTLGWNGVWDFIK